MNIHGDTTCAKYGEPVLPDEKGNCSLCGARLADVAIDNLVPVIYQEMSTDGQNESLSLYNYYLGCSQAEQSIVNDIMLYLTGWSFETLLEKAETFEA